MIALEFRGSLRGGRSTATLGEMHDAEKLRTIDNIFQPDVRSGGFGTANTKVEDLLERLKPFVLDAAVPEGVQVQFETAKNLCLYSWYVYRFHAVARQQLYATLELALRIRLYPPKGEAVPYAERGLKKYLEKAIKLRLFNNNQFSLVKWRALENAKWRYRQEVSEELIASGAESICFDDSHVVPEPSDYPEMLSVWAKTLPSLRNHQAHGSTSIWPSKGGDFELVAEMINQLFRAW